MPIKSVMIALITTTNKHFYSAFWCFLHDNNKYHIKNIKHIIINLLKIKACLSMPIIKKCSKKLLREITKENS